MSVLHWSQKTKVWEQGDGGGVPLERIIQDTDAEISWLRGTSHINLHTTRERKEKKTYVDTKAKEDAIWAECGNVRRAEMSAGAVHGQARARARL